jgi:hypothetical protein
MPTPAIRTHTSHAIVNHILPLLRMHGTEDARSRRRHPAAATAEKRPDADVTTAEHRRQQRGTSSAQAVAGDHPRRHHGRYATAFVNTEKSPPAALLDHAVRPPGTRHGRHTKMARKATVGNECNTERQSAGDDPRIAAVAIQDGDNCTNKGRGRRISNSNM